MPPARMVMLAALTSSAALFLLTVSWTEVESSAAAARSNVLLEDQLQVSSDLHEVIAPAPRASRLASSSSSFSSHQSELSRKDEAEQTEQKTPEEDGETRRESEMSAGGGGADSDPGPSMLHPVRIPAATPTSTGSVHRRLRWNNHVGHVPRMAMMARRRRRKKKKHQLLSEKLRRLKERKWRLLSLKQDLIRETEEEDPLQVMLQPSKDPSSSSTRALLGTRMPPKFRPSDPEVWEPASLLDRLDDGRRDEVARKGSNRRHDYDYYNGEEEEVEEEEEEEDDDDDDEGDVLTLDDVPANGRGVRTHEFRTVVNQITVGEEEDNDKDDGQKKKKGVVMAERRDADGTRFRIVETSGTGRGRGRAKRARGGRREKKRPRSPGPGGGRVYDKQPWRPVRRKKEGYNAEVEEESEDDAYYSYTSPPRERPAPPAERPRLVSSTEAGEEKNSYRFPRNEDHSEELQERPPEVTLPRRRPRAKRHHHHRYDPKSPFSSHEDPGVVAGSLRSSGVKDPDEPTLSEIDGGFFDEYVIDFPNDDVEHRYHERPLHLHPHGVRVQGGEDEGDHYEDDYADDVYVDADVPYGKRAGQKEQQQRQPYVPNYNTNYLHHNDFRQETLPTYRPYYYGQSYRNTYESPSPPPSYLTPSPSPPAFRSPNPYYKTPPPPSNAEYEIDHYPVTDDEEEGGGEGYRYFNFYDELAQDLGRHTRHRHSPQYHQEEEEELQQQHRYRQSPPTYSMTNKQKVKPGPNYESFRVPSPEQQRFRPSEPDFTSPDHQEFSQLHNDYSKDQTAYYDDEGDEGGESLQQRYRDGAQGGLYKEEEEEEADRHAQLAPNSIYREEVRDSAEEEEDEGEGERGRGGGLYRQYADYEGDERDVMGYRGRDSQLVYPEEQEYEQREEAKETPDRGEEGEEDDDGYRHHRYREEDDDDDHRSRYKQEESRHRRRRPPPSYVDYDPDYYDVSEDDHHDRFSDALASRDDGVWDDYFDGHRKDIDYDIGDLIQNDESYGPDEGAADQSGKQPQAEEGERRREQPPPDYEDEGGGGDDERQRYRSNDEEEEEEEDERGQQHRNGDEEDGGPPSPDYDTYMELQKKEREMERELEADVDQKFADHYRNVPGAREAQQQDEEGRPYFVSFEHVHRPRPYRSGYNHPDDDDNDDDYGPRRPLRRRQRPRAFINTVAPDNSDIPGFDDFFAKIERAVDSEIQRSPYQDGREEEDDGDSWRPPRPDSDSDDVPPDGVSDNSGDLMPTVYRHDPGRPESLGFRMPSHAELEENYRTEVTAGSAPDPVFANPASFEPKRIVPRRKVDASVLKT